jgi:SAM-dependent methyltransferase
MGGAAGGGAGRAPPPNAALRNVSNVEWMGADSLAELSGRYDLVISQFVFQHIPSREGERILATLLRGLRPGGIGAIHLPLRPDRPLAGLLRWTRKLDWSYPYMLMNSYSLSRLGWLLADGGVEEWHLRHVAPERTGQSYDVTIIFRKD